MELTGGVAVGSLTPARLIHRCASMPPSRVLVVRVRADAPVAVSLPRRCPARIDVRLAAVVGCSRQVW